MPIPGRTFSPLGNFFFQLFRRKAGLRASRGPACMFCQYWDFFLLLLKLPSQFSRDCSIFVISGKLTSLLFLLVLLSTQTVPPRHSPSFPREPLAALLPHLVMESDTSCHPDAFSPVWLDKFPLAEQTPLPCHVYGMHHRTTLHSPPGSQDSSRKKQRWQRSTAGIGEVTGNSRDMWQSTGHLKEHRWGGTWSS